MHLKEVMLHALSFKYGSTDILLIMLMGGVACVVVIIITCMLYIYIYAYLSIQWLKLL